MHDYLLKSANGHKYGCVLLSLKDSAAEILMRWAYDNIPESDLVEDGFDKSPHVTVLYGLDKVPVDDVISTAQGSGPIAVGIGETSIFEAPEYDVVKIDVGSPGLRRLNKRLKTLPHVETHAEYKPHLTLAYVKKGAGKKYVGLQTPLYGSALVFASAVYSTADKERTVIPLGPKPLLLKGYKLHGRTDFQGLKISIENRKGSIRRGVGEDGVPWSTKMFWPYGYICRTTGVDSDHADCYLGPNKESRMVFIIHQRDPKTGKPDEDKVMLGFDSETAARDAFLAHYDDHRFLGPITTMSIEEFKRKAADTMKKPCMIKSHEPAARGKGYLTRDELLAYGKKPRYQDAGYKISRQEAIEAWLRLKLDAERPRISFQAFWDGMNVEIEHGRQDPETDVTHNDLMSTAKIALAHLREQSDYYRRLKQVEGKGEVRKAHDVAGEPRNASGQWTTLAESATPAERVRNSIQVLARTGSSTLERIVKHSGLSPREAMTALDRLQREERIMRDGRVYRLGAPVKAESGDLVMHRDVHGALDFGKSYPRLRLRMARG